MFKVHILCCIPPSLPPSSCSVAEISTHNVNVEVSVRSSHGMGVAVGVESIGMMGLAVGQPPNIISTQKSAHSEFIHKYIARCLRVETCYPCSLSSAQNFIV